MNLRERDQYVERPDDEAPRKRGAARVSELALVHVELRHRDAQRIGLFLGGSFGIRISSVTWDSNAKGISLTVLHLPGHHCLGDVCVRRDVQPKTRHGRQPRSSHMPGLEITSTIYEGSVGHHITLFTHGTDSAAVFR